MMQLLCPCFYMGQVATRPHTLNSIFSCMLCRLCRLQNSMFIAMFLVTSNSICACQIKAHNGTRNVHVVAETIDDAIVMSMFLYGASCHARP
jgi:hypothetical protein